jgi:RNA polymerase sigma-70 factor (ECF subfamily)
MSGSEPAKEVLPQQQREEERRLVEAAQRDVARFAELYEYYFESVYAYVARRVRDRSQSEDLTADVFRKALQSLPRFKWTGAPFAAWLFRIASNLIVDRAKRDARARDPGSSTAGVTPASGGRSSATHSQQIDLEDCERRAQLFRLVDQLAEEQRRVLLMRFVEDRSIREIAGQMGRSEGAIKQLQFRALEKLREKFTTKDIEKKIDGS